MLENGATRLSPFHGENGAGTPVTKLPRLTRSANPNIVNPTSTSDQRKWIRTLAYLEGTKHQSDDKPHLLASRPQVLSMSSQRLSTTNTEISTSTSENNELIGPTSFSNHHGPWAGASAATSEQPAAVNSSPTSGTGPHRPLVPRGRRSTHKHDQSTALQTIASDKADAWSGTGSEGAPEPVLNHAAASLRRESPPGSSLDRPQRSPVKGLKAESYTRTSSDMIDFSSTQHQRHNFYSTLNVTSTRIDSPSYYDDDAHEISAFYSDIGSESTSFYEGGDGSALLEPPSTQVASRRGSSENGENGSVNSSHLSHSLPQATTSINETGKSPADGMCDQSLQHEKSNATKAPEEFTAKHLILVERMKQVLGVLTHSKPNASASSVEDRVMAEHDELSDGQKPTVVDSPHSLVEPETFINGERSKDYQSRSDTSCSVDNAADDERSEESFGASLKWIQRKTHDRRITSKMTAADRQRRQDQKKRVGNQRRKQDKRETYARAKAQATAEAARTAVDSTIIPKQPQHAYLTQRPCRTRSQLQHNHISWYDVTRDPGSWVVEEHHNRLATLPNHTARHSLDMVHGSFTGQHGHIPASYSMPNLPSDRPASHSHNYLSYNSRESAPPPTPQSVIVGTGGSTYGTTRTMALAQPNANEGRRRAQPAEQPLITRAETRYFVPASYDGRPPHRGRHGSARKDRLKRRMGDAGCEVM